MNLDFPRLILPLLTPADTRRRQCARTRISKLAVTEGFEGGYPTRIEHWRIYHWRHRLTTVLVTFLPIVLDQPGVSTIGGQPQEPLGRCQWACLSPFSGYAA
jgi:hypothetical protein